MLEIRGEGKGEGEREGVGKGRLEALKRLEEKFFPEKLKKNLKIYYYFLTNKILKK